jgi:hypothetical protein
MMWRWLRSKVKNDRFKEWQRQNPTRPFKDFFAESVVSKLAQGKAHKSLGGNLRDGMFGLSGQKTFKRLTRYGLKPTDRCVDYGCGTLRIGIHAINHLGPGLYWGMDISEALLQEGRTLIGETLWKKKQPQLRVISAETVAEVAAIKPTMLFSIKVMIHVHPDELPEYIRNIMTIIGTSGQAIVIGKWSNQETLKIGELSWLHAASRVGDIVSANGGCMEILTEEERERAGFGENSKFGALRFAHVS